MPRLRELRFNTWHAEHVFTVTRDERGELAIATLSGGVPTADALANALEKLRPRVLRVVGAGADAQAMIREIAEANGVEVELLSAGGPRPEI